MGDVWIFGPFMLQQKWGLYALAFLMSYVLVNVVLKMKLRQPSVLDIVMNGFFLFLVVWKLSYTLLHPLQVFRNPITQLYFTGGEKGVVFAFVSVVIYFYIKGKRGDIPFQTYMEISLIAMIAGLGVFQLLKWLIYMQGDYSLLFEFLLAFGLIIYWLLKVGDQSTKLWLQILFTFSLGELFLSYFKPQITILFGFSFSQLVYIILSLICLFVLYTWRPRVKEG